jgi:hypothetical protein
MNLQNTNERQVQKQLQKRHQGKNKCKSSDKNLDNTSRLIEEAALSGSNRKASGFAGGYLLPEHFSKSGRITGHEGDCHDPEQDSYNCSVACRGCDSRRT